MIDVVNLSELRLRAETWLEGSLDPMRPFDVLVVLALVDTLESIREFHGHRLEPGVSCAICDALERFDFGDGL